MKKQFWTDLWWLMVYAFVGLLLVCGAMLAIMGLTQGTLAMHLVQWAQTVLLMILPPALWVKWYKKERVCETLRLRMPAWKPMLWAAVLMTVSLPWLSAVESGTAALCDAWLPEALRLWAKDMLSEQEAAIAILTDVQGVAGWAELIGLMCIGTAIGEEMMFRGALLRCFLQPEADGGVRRSISPSRLFWTACWVGLAFSAIHMDLYGLVTRWLLGALFVYIVYWTGSLWPAIAAHATNNLWALIQMKAAPAWMERLEGVVPVAISILLSAAVLVWWVRKRERD